MTPDELHDLFEKFELLLAEHGVAPQDVFSLGGALLAKSLAVLEAEKRPQLLGDYIPVIIGHAAAMDAAGIVQWEWERVDD